MNRQWSHTQHLGIEYPIALHRRIHFGKIDRGNWIIEWWSGEIEGSADIPLVYFRCYMQYSLEVMGVYVAYIFIAVANGVEKNNHSVTDWGAHTRTCTWFLHTQTHTGKLSNTHKHTHTPYLALFYIMHLCTHIHIELHEFIGTGILLPRDPTQTMKISYCVVTCTRTTYVYVCVCVRAWDLPSKTPMFPQARQPVT